MSDKKTDYTTVPSHLLPETCGVDGTKWAAAFMQHAEKHGPGFVEEGNMIGWFCNAIEQARDVFTGETT